MRVISQLYKFTLADGRVLFFTSEKVALDSVRLSYHAMPGFVSQTIVPGGTTVEFNHVSKPPETVGVLERVYSGEMIYTSAEHL